jgi:hypothetical protein
MRVVKLWTLDILAVVEAEVGRVMTLMLCIRVVVK